MKPKPSKTAYKHSIIPDKVYFKIGDVAKIIGVKPYVLRYWETEFPEIKPVKSKAKQRMYKRKEVELILRIKDLLYKEKFTIEGARKRLKEVVKNPALVEESPQISLQLPTVPEASRGVLAEIKNRLHDLSKVIEHL